jgi:hypothetical protein
MSFNLSQFKKVHEDSDRAVLQHPMGHRIEISKSALSGKMAKDLKKLPLHMDVGGAVPGEGTDAEAPQQPTIVINTAQPQQAPAAPQWPDPASYFKNGTFNSDLFAIQNPNIPPSAKIEALQRVDAQEQAQRMADQQAQEKQNADLQKRIADAQRYNQFAAQRGLPPVAVPEAPSVQVASLDNSGLLGGGMQDEGVAPALGETSQAPRGPNDPWGTETYYKTMQQGMEQQKAGIQQEAQALGKQAAAETIALQNAINSQQQKTQNYQQNFDKLNEERNAVIADFESKHIDPDRYINNMSGGKKIRTAIGMILGGMGAGLLHQENPVMKYLNQQIENDIQSQKEELGKGRTLLDANFRQYGNLRDATDMTRVMMNDMVGNQLKLAASQTQDPIVKARAMQKMGELDQKNASVLSQIAMRRTLLGSMNMGGGGAGGTNPSMVIRMLVPEGQQQAAYKELGEAQGSMKARDNLLGAFDKLSKINTIAGRITSPIQTPKQVNAIVGPLLAQLSKETAGRFSEADAEFLKPLFPAPGDDDGTLRLKKAKMMSLIQEKMNFPILSSYGVNLGVGGSGGRFGGAGEKTIKLNPPVSSRISDGGR